MIWIPAFDAAGIKHAVGKMHPNHDLWYLHIFTYILHIFTYILHIFTYIFDHSFLILRLFKNRKTISKRFPSVVSTGELFFRCICKECRDRPENSLDAMSAAMGVSCGPCGPANAAKLAAAVPLFGGFDFPNPGWGGCRNGGVFVKFSDIWILRYWCREIDLMLTFGVEWRNMEKFWLCWWTIRVAKKVNDNPEHYRHNFTWSISKKQGVKLQLDGIYV